MNVLETEQNWFWTRIIISSLTEGVDISDESLCATMVIIYVALVIFKT